MIAVFIVLTGLSLALLFKRMAVVVVIVVSYRCKFKSKNDSYSF
jgi:hypothetical protein